MIYKRIWLLGITIGGILKYYKETYYNENSLKIDFNVTTKAAGAFPKGNITIYGLNNSDLQYYAALNQKRGFANNIFYVRICVWIWYVCAMVTTL